MTARARLQRGNGARQLRRRRRRAARPAPRMRAPRSASSGWRRGRSCQGKTGRTRSAAAPCSSRTERRSVRPRPHNWGTSAFLRARDKCIMLPTMAERASWDEYFMNIARVVSTRSTCDRKHVGAVIVRDKTILSTGYNGSIRGLPHCDEVGHLMEDGHCVRTIHAEANAICRPPRTASASTARRSTSPRRPAGTASS